jgi:hypothetical protein
MPGEIPFHLVLSGTAIPEDADGGDPLQLGAGDIVLLPQGSAHVLHDGSAAPPTPVRERRKRNLTISENAGAGDRLDMLCGRFALAPEHGRLIRAYISLTLLVIRPGGKAIARSAARFRVRPLLCDVVLATPKTVFQDIPHKAFGIAPNDGVNLLWPEVIGSIRGRHFV